MKKRLTQAEEFEIMKLVLDKFLWLGIAIMGIGVYIMVAGKMADPVVRGLGFIIAGAIVLILFMMLLVKEYEIIK
ncbi:hypothetical protein JXA85_08035 [Candidatus Woesearchaeota archaeon]|nr:hypothetical protein [Candidatus Woesearchaeota archaeon]